MPATSALVIGGSLAGMCAARVLSDVFDKVTIIERDAYPSAPDFRQGVPQARHVHNLLARGLRELLRYRPTPSDRTCATERALYGALLCRSSSRRVSS